MSSELLVEQSAWVSILDSSKRDAMRETGGVLLGWRHERGVYVHDALVVEDKHAKHTFYRRRHQRATDVLNAALAALPKGSLVGYVGEWHSHPAMSGPSWVDRFEMRRISRQTKAPVGLLVCMYDVRADTFTAAGVLAERGRASRVQVVFRNGDED